MRIIALLLIALLPSACVAQDAHVARLHDVLVPLRANPDESDEKVRGASDKFTAIKGELRDWIETRLATFAVDGDEYLFQRMLNHQLVSSDLACRFPPNYDGPACMGGKSEKSELGYLGDITISRQEQGYDDHFLIVRTGVGILCGFDESATVYKWDKTAWRRVVEIEQTQYTRDHYQPRKLYSVALSPKTDDKTNLVLALGGLTWCSSNWRAVYYSAWRIGPDFAEPKALADRKEFSFADHDTPIVGSVGRNDILLEFATGSVDSDRGFHEAVRHFHVDGDLLQQIGPFALNPVDFVDEWLSRSAHETKDWGAPISAAATAWRAKHPGKIEGTTFDESVKHCRKMPDLRQVDLSLGETGNAHAYFLVRWTPPYRFELVDVLEKPRPDCDRLEEDADMPSTLFPIQDWRE